MHYFIIYNKNTGDITGYFKTSTTEFLPNPRTPEEAFVEVTEKDQIEPIASMDLKSHWIRGKVKNKKIEGLKIHPVFQGKIRLITDAEDRDGDGLPELAADGKSSAKIKVTIYDLEGHTVADRPVTVRFRVSRGAISKRYVQTKDGIAEIDLTSTSETTQSQVTAEATDFESDGLIFEFIPVEEFQTLAKGKRKK